MTLPPNSGPPSEYFGALPKSWRNTETKYVLIGVDGSYWNLSGNYAGKEGLTLAPHLEGVMHTQWKSVFHEGPYMKGAEYGRTDWTRRTINLGVQVGIEYGPDSSSWRYRMLEQKWWKAWSPTEDCYLGCFTRTHGWRFLRVRLAEAPRTPFELDPVAFNNNFMQWDMVIVALQPYWTKKMLTDSWQNDSVAYTEWSTIGYMLAHTVNQFLGDLGLLSKNANDGLLVPGKSIGKGILNVWNNGDQPAWPKYLISSPGQAWIQDGPGGTMIPLPLLSDQDGAVLLDTDDTARTITCSTDPIDPLLYQIMSKAGLVDVIFNNLLSLAESAEPVWQRFKYSFTQQIPANTQANIQVYHSDPKGSVTVMMPQMYDKAYG